MRHFIFGGLCHFHKNRWMKTHPMSFNVLPSLHMNMCLLLFLLPAIVPYCACPVEYDHTAASSALAVHCVSGEMNRVPCSSFWLTTKVLLVFISGVQWSRKMEPCEVGLCQNKHLCICMMMHIQILLLSPYYANVSEVRL